MKEGEDENDDEPELEFDMLTERNPEDSQVLLTVKDNLDVRQTPQQSHVSYNEMSPTSHKLRDELKHVAARTSITERGAESREGSPKNQTPFSPQHSTDQVEFQLQ